MSGPKSFGELVDELFERGLEIALAGAFIINGVNAVDVRRDGEPLAPFLRSSLAILSPSPTACAIGMIAAGVCYLVLLMVDIRRPLPLARCVVSVLSGILYLLIVTATLTGAEPRTAALRYVWSGALAFLCFLAPFRLVLAERGQSQSQPLRKEVG